jgi:hypothetical protein
MGRGLPLFVPSSHAISHDDGCCSPQGKRARPAIGEDQGLDQLQPGPALLIGRYFRYAA